MNYLQLFGGLLCMILVIVMWLGYSIYIVNYLADNEDYLEKWKYGILIFSIIVAFALMFTSIVWMFGNWEMDV